MSRRRAAPLLFGLAFVVLGLPDFGHGVAWPAMRATFHRPLADLGTFLVAQAAGYLTLALTAGRLAARWSVEGLVIASTVLCSAGLLLVAGAPSWEVVVAGGLVLGAGSGGMDTGLNAAVALRSDGSLMGFLHAGYGVGAALGPVVVGASLATGGGWRPPYVVFATVTAMLVFLVPGRSMGAAPPQQSHAAGRGTGAACAAFFVYVALEVTVGQWAFTFLTQRHHLGDLAGSLWVAAYWGGLTAGRLWLGVRGHRAPVNKTLALSLVGAVGGVFVVWLAGPLAPLGLPLIGLSLSAVFPLLVLVTPQRVGAHRATAAMGWQMAAATAGGAAGPAAAGALLGWAGVTAFGPVAAGMAVTLCLVVALASRLSSLAPAELSHHQAP